MEVYLQTYCRFDQDDWVRLFAMAKFAYNNSRKANTILSFFEVLLGYHSRISYEDNRNLQSKFWAKDRNVAALPELIKELKVNLAESQELQTLKHNKHVMEHIY